VNDDSILFETGSVLHGLIRSMRANAVREEAVSYKVCLFWLIPCPLFLNADYPVGFTNELGPALHAIHSIGVDRLPSWTHWLLAKPHVRLCWSSVSLLRIAIDTSQYAVRPSRLSTLSTRDNVVNREFFAARLLSTVLAGHRVTLEYVSSAEGNLLRRHRVELG
jgi:hypothetical protein